MAAGMQHDPYILIRFARERSVSGHYPAMRLRRTVSIRHPIVTSIDESNMAAHLLQQS